MGLVSEDGGRTAGSPGYVYLIHHPSTGLHKIGRSVNPFNRLSQIASKDAGLEMVSYIASADCVWLEQFFHQAYSHRRVRNEWFKLSAEDVEQFKTIAEVDDIGGIPPWLIRQHETNKQNGFEWGEQDDNAELLKPRHSGRRLVVYVDQADYDLLQRHISKQAVEVKMSACVRRGIRLFLQSVGELPAA